MDPARREEFQNEYWLPWTTQRSKQEIFLALQREGVPVGPRNTIAEVVQDVHLRERGFWAEIDHPVAGRLRYPGPPVRLGQSWEIRRPAPLLGQHNDEILRHLGYSREDQRPLAANGVI